MKLCATIVMFCVVLAGCGATTTTMTIQPDVADATADVVTTISVSPTLPAHDLTSVPNPLATQVSNPTITEGSNSAITWEGLTFDVPPNHLWGIQPLDQINGVPMLARGWISYDATGIQPGLEVSNGIGFTIIQFTGTLEEWLSLTVAAAPNGNPVNQDTIQQLTIAGRPAIAFSYNVTGTGDNRILLVKQGPDRLLIINDYGYASVVENLRIEDR